VDQGTRSFLLSDETFSPSSRRSAPGDPVGVGSGRPSDGQQGQQGDAQLLGEWEAHARRLLGAKGEERAWIRYSSTERELQSETYRGRARAYHSIRALMSSLLPLSG